MSGDVMSSDLLNVLSFFEEEKNTLNPTDHTRADRLTQATEALMTWEEERRRAMEAAVHYQQMCAVLQRHLSALGEQDKMFFDTILDFRVLLDASQQSVTSKKMQQLIDRLGLLDISDSVIQDVMTQTKDLLMVIGELKLSGDKRMSREVFGQCLELVLEQCGQLKKMNGVVRRGLQKRMAEEKRANEMKMKQQKGSGKGWLPSWLS